MDRFEGVYCGPAPAPADLWSSWNLDPFLLVTLGLLAFMLRGSSAGLGATAVLALAFVSPLCALSAALFSARVVHHILLVAVAAPLLVVARPARGASAIGPPFLLFTGALWLWHVPAAYDLALSNVAVYWVMQVTLLASATVFWRAILRPGGAALVAVVWSVAAFMAMGLLGAILTFVPDQLYAAHASAPLDWGFLPLADQRLGGLIMWVPASVPYFVVIAFLCRREWERPAGRTT